MAEAVFQPAAILDPKVFGLPVDREVLFSNHKNLYKKRIEKRQRKLFVKIGPVKPFLRRNEKILLVTTGYSPLSSLAQVLTSFFFSYLTRSLFVFTNQRIIHLPATSSYNYRDTLAQIAYSGCKSIALKGGTLVVEYSRRGKIEKFKAIAVPERKKIRALLKKSIPLSGTKGHLAARIHLCPRCARPLTAKKYKCSHCQLGFKSRIVAALLAIVVPGGGYFYVRQYLLGALDAVLEGFLLAFSLVLLIDYYDRIPVNKIYLVGIPAIYLYVKITAIIHSSHFIDEYIPTKKNITPGKKS